MLKKSMLVNIVPKRDKMSINSRKDHFFIYPKDKTGKVTGHTICIALRDGEMYEGVTLCSPEDNFNRKIGRQIALSRALEAYEKVKQKREQLK